MRSQKRPLLDSLLTEKVDLELSVINNIYVYRRMRTKFTRLKTINMNFTWSTTQKGEKAIRYNHYLYRLKRESQNGSSIYVCTIKSYGRLIALKNDVITKSDGRSHNHAPKLSENVQAVLTELKRRILTDNDQSIGRIYNKEEDSSDED